MHGQIVPQIFVIVRRFSDILRLALSKRNLILSGAFFFEKETCMRTWIRILRFSYGLERTLGSGSVLAAASHRNKNAGK